ncbi:MAG: nuclear transport factor 2 family protein [Pyrinomonadaceae bacterium]
MKKFLSINHPIVLLILLALFFGASCRNEQKPNAPKENVSDSEYLKNAGAEWDRLFNARDIANLSDLYAEDAVSMPYNYQTVSGKKAVRAELEKFFEQTDAAKHETFPEEIITKDDVSIERSRYINTYTPKGTSNRIVETGRHVICRKKINGKWLITWEIWNSDQPLPK